MPFLLIFIFIFSACVHNSKKEKSPKIYFEQALYYKEKKNYVKALENLSSLRKQFFYSHYNQKALLLTADIYFSQKKYSSAVKSYERHRNLYPKIREDYVLYRIGLSYQKQLPQRADHDLSLAEPALKAFSAVLSLNPNSSYKKKAHLERQKILNKKASRELKTALFFKTQGWNKASLRRIQYFIKKYSQSSLMPKALFIGIQLSHQLNQNPLAFRKLLIENYPKSEEAQIILKNKKESIFSKWRQRLL